MSILKPTININPQYATNQTDTHQAGLYQISPNNSNLIVRVNTSSNIGLSGEIQLNTSITPPIFQGYNGLNWIDFNATQGLQGIPGQDFTNAVNFNNLGLPGDTNVNVAIGSIFASTFVDVSQSISNVDIRSLQGGSHIVNSNLSIQSLTLSQNSNIITLQPQPLPYKWDFSGSNNTISLLKNSPIDTINYSWGETSKWIVKQGSTVSKGQAVRITRETTTSNIVIIPITYTTLSGVSPFSSPMNMLGIATQNANSGESCIVCTKGITTVLCTSNITTDFIASTDVAVVGIDGIVGKDGGVFCNTTPVPMVDYIRAGYFLESGVGVANNGNYSLFYVEPRFQIS
jgi:hypothetical protein